MPMNRCLLFHNYGTVLFGCPLWREVGSISSSTLQCNFATNGRSVSMSSCPGPSGANHQKFQPVSQLRPFPIRAPSLRRAPGLSIISHGLKSLSICTHIFIFVVVDTCYIHKIYKPFISPGSVQQIMPYWLWLKSLAIWTSIRVTV
jgi:hypothetical protein